MAEVCDGCQRRPCVCTTISLPKAESDDAREALARRIVRDRLNYFGISDEQIDAERLMEPVDHEAHGCLPVQPGLWECFNEFDSPNHPRHDWADEAAEWVCWVLDHPSIASVVFPPGGESDG